MDPANASRKFPNWSHHCTAISHLVWVSLGIHTWMLTLLIVEYNLNISLIFVSCVAQWIVIDKFILFVHSVGETWVKKSLIQFMMRVAM